MSKYVIVDLEMCRVPKPRRCKEYHWATETIQIGAVLVDENLEIVDEFNTYVHPQYGSIDSFIENLTGITNRDVKNACEMKEALESFIDWIPEDAICISWSETDKIQIRREAKAKMVESSRLENIFENWQDCQLTFTNKMNADRPFNLKEALIACNIMYDEQIHNGLVDAKNTALLFIKMEKEPKLVLNEYYRRCKEDETDSNWCTLGDLCPALNLAIA